MDANGSTERSQKQDKASRRAARTCVQMAKQPQRVGRGRAQPNKVLGTVCTSDKAASSRSDLSSLQNNQEQAKSGGNHE